MRNVKAFPGEFQHASVVVDLGKKKTRNVVRKICTKRRKQSLLKDVMIRKRFEENVIELVHLGTSNVWGHFKDGVLDACDEVCGKKTRCDRGSFKQKNIFTSR